MDNLVKNQSNLSDKEMKRISLIYEKSLVIPDRKLDKQIMICPIGLIGTGKTTVVKLLNRKLFLLRISIDEIRKILKENDFDYNRAKEIGINLVNKYIKRRYSIILDTDCVSKESQRYIKFFKEKCNLEIIWIHINPPEEFVINKLKNYKHTWLFKDGDHAVSSYKKRKLLHNNLNFDFLYVFDPSKDNLKKQIDNAVEKIQQIGKK